MNVLHRALRILEGLTKHIDKIKDIKRRSAGQTPVGLEKLLCDVTKNREDTKQMIDNINEYIVLNSEEQAKLEEKFKILEESESDLYRRIAELEGIIFKQDERIKQLEEKAQGYHKQLTLTQSNLKETRNELTATKNKLKEIESTLHTGQIAFDFEKDLATYIYPDDKKFGSRRIFTNMKKWLEDKKDTVQGREANEKWNALKDEFSWSSEHERVFFKLLDFRKKGAHPDIDHDAIQSQIPEEFNDEEKKCIKHIISIIERVKELMF